MESKNIEILKDIFNWVSISEISELEMKKLAGNMDIQLADNFLLKCSWSYFKKCKVLSLEKEPLIFCKYVRENYFFEILGLHLTKYYFDGELCFKNFLTGLIKDKKKPIPHITTIYERGEDIGNKKYNVADFKQSLGRQCYLHEILSLYDVYDRHFIVRDNGSLCRIDFGRCFENLDKKYLGFHDYLKDKHIDYYDQEFQKGYKFERAKIKENLKDKRKQLSNIVRNIKNLEKDYDIIYFDPEKFSNRLIDHWSRIGFLKDANITECEWI
ncbi:MAG: hypothetical protein EU532_10625 [Promethearchaeota archaeon]|nr:MAG: hypothetical protein EU532_10625 [Candidatus Lokiarchaeota archaeon]